MIKFSARSILSCVAIIAISFCSIPALATTYVYEPFNYTAPAPLQGEHNVSPGTLAGTNPNGTGTSAGNSWLQAGTANPPSAINIASGNLTTPGLQVSTSSPNNDLTINGVGNGSGATNRLAIAANPVPGTIYFSFLLNVSALTGTNTTTGDFFFSFNNTANTSQATNPTVAPGRVYGRKDPVDATKYDLGIFTNHNSTAAATSWSSGLTVGSTVFVVGSIDVTSTTNNAARLWINPDPSTYGVTTAPGGNLIDSTASTINVGVQSILLRQSIAPFLTMDELRVASSWAEVTPISSLYWDTDGAPAGAGGATPSDTWDGSLSKWSDSPNGDVATHAYTPNVNAIFSAGSDAIGAYTVTVSGTQAAGALTFEDGAPTLSGGTISLGGPHTITSNTGVTATIGSVVTGSLGLVKEGAGTLALTGNETYTGATSINTGTLQLGDGGTGGTLPTASAITTTGTFAVKQSDTVTQGTDFSGAAISGTGGFTQAGTGTTTLNVANTFSGTTRATDGALVLTNSLALQNSTLDMNASDIGSVTFDNSLTAITVGGLSGTRNFSANSAVALTVGNGNKTAGPYSGVLGGTGTLTKIGTGTQTISGANTYNGGTTISAGTLQFGKTIAMPVAGAVTVAANATLSVNAGGTGEWTDSTDDTIGGTIASIIKGRGGQGTANQVTWTANSALGIDTTNAPVSGLGAPEVNYTGVIGGFRTAGAPTDDVGLTKRGDGYLTLSTTNTFRGPLTVGGVGVSGGVVRITAPQPNMGQSMAIPTVILGNADANLVVKDTGIKILTNDALPANTLIQFGGSINGNNQPSSLFQLYDPEITTPVTNFTETSYNQTIRGLSGGNGRVKVGLGTLTINVPLGESYVYSGTLRSDINIFTDDHGKIIKTGKGKQEWNQANANTQGDFILQDGTAVVGDAQVFGVVNGAAGLSARLIIEAGGPDPNPLPRLATNGNAVSLAVPTVQIKSSFAVDCTANSLQFFGINGNGEVFLMTDNPTITVNPQSEATPTAGGMFGIVGQISEVGSTRGFTKSGNGFLTIQNPNNDYKGETVIQQGYLRLTKVAGSLVSPGVGADGRLGDPTAATNRVVLAGGVAGATLTYNGAQNDAVHTPGGVANPLEARTLTVPNKLRVSGTGTSTISYNSTTAALTDVTDPTGITMVFSNDIVDWTSGTLTFLHDGASQGITFRPTFTGSGFNYGGPVVISNGGGTRKTVLTSSNGASTTQTWSGDITGDGTYLRSAGGTTVLGGSTVSVGITNNSEVIFDRATAQAYSGAMTGSGNLTKTGGGVLTLSGTSGYLGSTAVNNGTMLVNGSLTGTSGVTVSGATNPATLGGTGSIAATAAVSVTGTVANSATIAPGASIGTLTTGAVTMGDYSHLAIEISGASTDLLTVSGALGLSSSLDYLDFSGTPSGAGPWVFATYTGSLGGNTFNNVTGLAGALAGYSVDYTQSGIIRLLAPPVGPGDYNGDTKVNAADYVTWRKDPANNGNDPGGYVTWRENFSQTAGSSSGLDGAAAVPEPAAMSLVLFAIGSIIVGSRRVFRGVRNN